MREISRYWVTLTRGFAVPLSDDLFPAARTFFDLVADALEEKLGLEASEVALGSTSGFEVSGVTEAVDENEASKKVYDMLVAALGLALDQTTAPDLPPAPNQPMMKAHELFGRPTETRVVLLATAAA